MACATALVSAWVVACGPSVQLIYEGNLRFEHCYRLDLDEQISPTHRLACWSEWVEYYAKGQTRDRVDYAKRRLEAMRSGDRAFLRLRLEEATDAGPLAAVAADPAPIPTSVHAPPPALLQAAPVPSVPTASTTDSLTSDKVEAVPAAEEKSNSGRSQAGVRGSKPRPMKKDPSKPTKL